MLDRIRKLLQPPAEQETLRPDDAVERFQQENTDQINAVNEQESTLRDDIRQALGDVEDALDDLEAYEHDNTRVADVTTNVAEDRLRQINAFDAPDDPETFYDALNELIADIREVSRKEQAVLDHVDGPVKQVFRQVDALEDHTERLEAFLDADYSVVQAWQELEQLVDRWRRLREEQNELEQELDAVDMATPRDTLQALTEKLDALDDDPEQERKAELEQDISDLEDRRDSLQQDVASAASAMERGLKKLLYQARNGDLSLSQEHVQVLEEIRDGTVAQEFTPPAGDVAAAVDAALGAIDQIDLSDRQQKKFRDGADQLRDLEQIRSTMEDISEEIATKQDALADLTIDDRRKELAQKRERTERTLQERRNEQEQLRERIQDKEEEITDVRQDIESLLDDHLHNDITVDPVNDG